MPGEYKADLTPWVRGMHDALDDPKVEKVVALKSAQVAWTDGVLLNYLGKRIDLDPCPMIIMFAKVEAAKRFNSEKFLPMVEVTPRLAEKIPRASKKDPNNKFDFKTFPGGFLKFVGSNSPSDVKSTPAPVVCVEEPDDCNDNVKNQGNTIKLLEERTKTYSRRKIIFGGTPTVAGLSKVEASYKEGDQRKFYVPCPHCGEYQVLEWENVRWDNKESIRHEIYGHADLQSARYVCPHCGGIWTNEQKNKAVRKGEWRSTAEFHGIASFYINEIYSLFPGSSLPNLVAKYLAAKKKADGGDDSDMRSFINNQLGRPYEFSNGMPDNEELMKKGEDYEEFTIPAIGCVLTAGVDVQHDRLAVIIRAWIEGEESWLVYWGEIYGTTMTPEQNAWVDLDALLKRKFKNKKGVEIPISAVSIDSSDGQTQDAVYQFVRRRKHGLIKFMAIKGSSINEDSKEIFSPPKQSVDTDFRNKAAKFGLKPYIVGTSRAKDLILGVDAKAGRIKLKERSGPGVMHFYKNVRPDYIEQLTSEVKAPTSRSSRLVWQKRSGVRNEALDCEVYALHAARSMKLHLWTHNKWLEKIQQQDQMNIFEASENPQKTEKPALRSEIEKEETFIRDDFMDTLRRSQGRPW